MHTFLRIVRVGGAVLGETPGVFDVDQGVAARFIPRYAMKNNKVPDRFSIDWIDEIAVGGSWRLGQPGLVQAHNQRAKFSQELR